jgi:ribosomal protein S18 acetylase RimI-like enzyme
MVSGMDCLDNKRMQGRSIPHSLEKIRLATERDVATLTALAKCDGYVYDTPNMTDAYHLEKMRQGDRFFILYNQDNFAVGYTSISDTIVKDPSVLQLFNPNEINSFGEYGLLHTLSVHKEHHGEGFGGQLIRKGIEQLKAEGKKTAYLLVIPQNKKAISIYTHLCFEVRGIAPNIYGGGLHRILMGMDLK